MKKLISILVALVMTFAAVGCGASGQSQATTPPSSSQNTQSSSQAESPNVDWPTKDIKILTTVKAGGNMDIKARLVSKYLSKEMGVNVIVENLPGGGGVTGMTQYLAEKPNTHSLMYMGVPHLTTAPFFNDVQYTKDDIIIISGLDTVENGLFVSAKSGLKTFEDLLKLGADGKIIKFGSAGINNDTFLFTKALLEQAGVKSDSVDSDSSTESLVNCVAGTVDVAYCATNLAKGYVEKGDLIPIGVFSEEAYTGYEGITVPSFKSLGYDVTYSATSFFAIRSGTDAAIVEKIELALDNICANLDFQKEFADAGYQLMEERSKETIDAEIDKIGKDLEGYRALFE